MFVVGIMTGTSVDGIDVVVIHFGQNECDFSVKFSKIYNFSTQLEIMLKGLVNNQKVTCEELATTQEQYELELLNAIALVQAESKLKCDLVAIHGQTVYHRPKTEDKPALTWQLGRGQHIAFHCGLPVACDFRQMDVLNQGHGAPLMPAIDAILNKSNQNVGFLNIGGIANISYISKDGVIGFDIGPGNCLIDLVMQQQFNQKWDNCGEHANRGTTCQTIVNKVMTDNYFSNPPPKSTGREYFSETFLKTILNDCCLQSLSDNDIVSTVTDVTVAAIVQAVEHFCHGIQKIEVTGGGCHNAYLMDRLAKRLPTITLSAADDSVHQNFREAIGFAILGYRRFHNIKTTLTTGSTKPLLLGDLFYKT